MTLPSSGSISMAQIRDEYGMGNPVSISQLYGKPGIPSSGGISFANFHGQSAMTWTPIPVNFVRLGRGSISQAFTSSSPSVWTWVANGGSSGSFSQAWGATASSVLITVSLPSAGSRRWHGTITSTAGNATKTWNVDITASNSGGL